MFEYCLWINIVIVDNVGRFDHFYIFKAFDSVKKLKLGVSWNACRDSVRIYHVGVESFGLEPHIVTVPLWEPLKLLFNGGTIPRANAIAVASTELCCPVKVISHYLVCILCCPCDVALDQWILRLHTFKFMEIAEPLDHIV